MRFLIPVLFWMFFQIPLVSGQETKMDCTNNPARSWWDVQHYDLNLNIDTATGKLNGTVIITAKVIGGIGNALQIDLKEPLKLNHVSSETNDNKQTDFKVEKIENHYIIKGEFNKIIKENGLFNLVIEYEGVPPIAARPPWDGGLVMDRDANGNRWMGMACQGIGASVWFPCKDFQGDEADMGMRLSMVVPGNLQMISNGRLQPNNERRSDRNLRWTWAVANPINNYDITFYIGDYVHWSDTLQGIKGPLSLDYFVLRENEAKAKEHFKIVKPMLECFESKIGAYPFYEDGYKLVDAPYLGMEHQSAVAYGNGYKMGYKGEDRSKSGVGLLFDFIIVHESGHEWFGNSITSYDKADTWIHEGFTTYTETIFAECLLGKNSAFIYQQGKRNVVRNDKPVQGKYNECDEGSSDHYDKAAFMIHMIRMVMKNDSAFFAMLKAMNETYYHKIVTGKEIAHFINHYSGIDFNKVFDQYLRTAAIPDLELKRKKNTLLYKWSNCVTGFNMPVLVHQNNKAIWLTPNTQWQKMSLSHDDICVDKNFLINRK
jgi:aminopeptidase N